MDFEGLQDCASSVSPPSSYRALKTLNPTSVAEELAASKAVLEVQIRTEVRSLAYPCGGYQHFDELNREAAAAAGYRLAFSLNVGSNPRERPEPFDLRRFGASKHPGRFAALAVFPRLFEWAA